MAAAIERGQNLIIAATDKATQNTSGLEKGISKAKIKTFNKIALGIDLVLILNYGVPQFSMFPIVKNGFKWPYK